MNFIKKYWDIVCGMLLGFASCILVSFKKENIQLIYSIVILILAFIGVLKVVKACIESDKKQSDKNRTHVIDKLVDSQSCMKAIDIAEHPTKTGEELGNLIVKTTKGERRLMKKLFTWIKLYWHQIIGFGIDISYACVVIYMYITDKFGFVLGWLPQETAWQISGKVIFGLISILFVFFSIRDKVKWVGVGTIESARKYLQDLSSGVTKGLSPEAKSTIKSHLKLLNKKLKIAEEETSKYDAKVSEITSSLKTLKELCDKGIGDSNEFNSKVDELNQTQKELTSATQVVEEIKAEIARYEDALK